MWDRELHGDGICPPPHPSVSNLSPSPTVPICTHPHTHFPHPRFWPCGFVRSRKFHQPAPHTHVCDVCVSLTQRSHTGVLGGLMEFAGADKAKRPKTGVWKITVSVTFVCVCALFAVQARRKSDVDWNVARQLGVDNTDGRWLRRWRPCRHHHLRSYWGTCDWTRIRVVMVIDFL